MINYHYDWDGIDKDHGLTIYDQARKQMAKRITADIDRSLYEQYKTFARTPTKMNTIATTDGGGIQVQGRQVWPTKIEIIADAKGGDQRAHVKMEFDANFTAAIAQPVFKVKVSGSEMG